MGIWDKAGGSRNFSLLAEKIFRMVESQSYLATRKLVDTVQEQEILEEEIEKFKPPFPERNSKGKLHWLLFTPFRYPPLRAGGRFHTLAEQSVFYGSREIETVMAEIAYKRFVFRACSRAEMGAMTVCYTKFGVPIKTEKGIDLTAAPFAVYRDVLSDPLSHTASQELGTEMRRGGVEAFLFYSARIRDGINCGLLSVEAFKSNRPENQQDWIIYDSADSMEFRRSLPLIAREHRTFRREDFLVKGKLPSFS